MAAQREVFSLCCELLVYSDCSSFLLSRAILAEVFKGISKDSVAMVTGNLLHQVLQGVLVKWAESRDEKGVSKNDIDGMMRVVLSSPEALNHL